MFVTYKVINASLYDSGLGQVVARVNYTYRIYPWGVIVREEIKWTSDDTVGVDYYFGGWVFDQDDGSGAEPMFTRVGNETGITNLPTYYTYPTQSGTLDNSVGTRPYDGTNYYLRVHRVNLAAGSHTITVDADECSWLVWKRYDNPGVIIYDPNGNYVTGGYDGMSGDSVDSVISVSFTASVGGYYYIVVYQYGDNCPFWSPDGQTTYDLLVDGSPVASNIQIRNYGNIYPYDAIKLYDLEITSSTQNINHEIKLTWSTSDNLDLYLYSPTASTGDCLAYSASADGSPEIITYNTTTIGHYTILVHGYSVSTSAPFTVEITAQAGPEFVDATGEGSISDLALFHHSINRGIGITFIQQSIPGTYSSINVMWHNEGDESDIDYIYWAKNVSSLQVSNGDLGYVRYAIIPWEPSGTTDQERYSGFNNTCFSVKNPLQASLGSIERYKIMVTVSVIDKDNNPIEGVNITFYNGTGYSFYSKLTDSSGEAKFDVERIWWNITATLTSGGQTYVEYTYADYNDSSVYNYTVHSDTKSITFSKLVKLMLYFYTCESPANLIQGGDVQLNSSASNNAQGASITITGKSDYEGKFSVYLPYGNWTIRFNKTKTSPEDWDNITVYTDPSLQNNITNFGRAHLINVSTSVTYYIKDWEYPPIGVQTVSTKLNVTTQPSPLDLYWKETFTVYVELIRTDTNEKINGTIYWWIFDALGNLIDNGSGITNDSTYSFTYNTSNINAGSFTLLINATVLETESNVEFLAPVEVEKALTVKKRPTSITTTFNPATAIYWNESLEITVEYKDELDGSPVTGANVTLKVVGIGQWTMIEVSPGTYRVYFANFQWDADIYTVIILASKQNYESEDATYTLVVYERPTYIDAPSYINIPWQNSYTIQIQYMDQRLDELILDANVTYELTNSSGVIRSGTMTYNNGYYEAILDLTQMVEGAYTIYIYANKTNYEEKTADIVFEIRVRDTTLTAETSSLTVIYEQRIEIKFWYYDEDFNEYIPGAQATYSISGVDIQVSISGTLQDLNNGTYVLNISTTDIGKIGTVSAYIELRKKHYEPQSTTVTIVIKEIPTEATPSATSIEVEWGLNVTLTVQWNRTDKSPEQGVPNAANASFKLYYNDTLVLKGNLTDYLNGTYGLILNTTMFVNQSHPYTGTYMLYVFLERQHYENQTLTISITVLEVVMLAVAQPNDLTMIWGYEENITIYYNRSRDGKFIQGATLTTTSTPQATGAFTVIEETGRYILSPLVAP